MKSRDEGVGRCFRRGTRPTRPYGDWGWRVFFSVRTQRPFFHVPPPCRQDLIRAAPKIVPSLRVSAYEATLKLDSLPAERQKVSLVFQKIREFGLDFLRSAGLPPDFRQ